MERKQKWQEAWRNKWQRAKDEPPFPEKLPGEFCVIAYERDRERYILIVDDEGPSSYDLGGNIEFILQQFERWGRKKHLSDTLDLAREFGMAQGIFADNRTIALFERGVSGGQLVFGDGQDKPRTVYVPALRG